MDYIFGTIQRNGKTVETLKTVGDKHTSLPAGSFQLVREYPDQTITDCCIIVERYDSKTDVSGKCYDWYEITGHYRYTDKSQQVKAYSDISFVALAETGAIDGVTAGEHLEAFAEWAYPIAFTPGQMRKFFGKLYRCIQGHTSQADWTPDAAPSLWTLAADPSEEYPPWSQPVGAHDAYGLGDRTSHNGKRWISEAENNVWEPGVYGWREVTA